MYASRLDALPADVVRRVFVHADVGDALSAARASRALARVLAPTLERVVSTSPVPVLLDRLGDGVGGLISALTLKHGTAPLNAEAAASVASLCPRLDFMAFCGVQPEDGFDDAALLAFVDSHVRALQTAPSGSNRTDPAASSEQEVAPSSCAASPPDAASAAHESAELPYDLPREQTNTPSFPDSPEALPEYSHSSARPTTTERSTRPLPCETAVHRPPRLLKDDTQAPLAGSIRHMNGAVGTSAAVDSNDTEAAFGSASSSTSPTATTTTGETSASPSTTTPFTTTTNTVTTTSPTTTPAWSSPSPPPSASTAGAAAGTHATSGATSTRADGTSPHMSSARATESAHVDAIPEESICAWRGEEASQARPFLEAEFLPSGKCTGSASYDGLGDNNCPAWVPLTEPSACRNEPAPPAPPPPAAPPPQETGVAEHLPLSVPSVCLPPVSIEELRVEFCGGITGDAIVSASALLPNLRRITMKMSGKLDDSHVAAIAENVGPRLVELDVQCSASVSDSSLFALAELCPNLALLGIGGCPDVTDDGLQVIAEALGPTLLALDIHDLPLVSDLGIYYVANSCRNLEYMNMWHVGLTSFGVQCIAETAGDTLRVLVIGDSTDVDDEALVSIVDQCSVLDELEMIGLANVTDAAMCSLLDATWGPPLKSLSIDRCPRLSDISIRAIAESQTLTVVSANGLPGVTRAAMSTLGALSHLRLRCDDDPDCFLGFAGDDHGSGSGGRRLPSHKDGPAASVHDLLIG